MADGFIDTSFLKGFPDFFASGTVEDACRLREQSHRLYFDEARTWPMFIIPRRRPTQPSQEKLDELAEREEETASIQVKITRHLASIDPGQSAFDIMWVKLTEAQRKEIVLGAFGMLPKSAGPIQNGGTMAPEVRLERMVEGRGFLELLDAVTLEEVPAVGEKRTTYVSVPNRRWREMLDDDEATRFPSLASAQYEKARLTAERHEFIFTFALNVLELFARTYRLPTKPITPKPPGYYTPNPPKPPAPKPPAPKTEAKSAIRACTSCGRPESLLPGGAKLRKCMKCEGGAYCDRDCQTKDWPQHKPTCHKVSKA